MKFGWGRGETHTSFWEKTYFKDSLLLETSCLLVCTSCLAVVHIYKLVNNFSFLGTFCIYGVILCS